MWEVIMWYQDAVLVSEQPQTFIACSPLPNYLVSHYTKWSSDTCTQVKQALLDTF